MVHIKKKFAILQFLSSFWAQRFFFKYLEPVLSPYNDGPIYTNTNMYNIVITNAGRCKTAVSRSKHS